MAPTIYFRVPLTCTNCGSLNDGRSIDFYASPLGTDPIQTNAYPGTVLELQLEEFDEAFLPVRPPLEGELSFGAIELWGCQTCNRLRAARLEFRLRTADLVEFVGASVVSLTTEVLDEANFVTRRLNEWLPMPGEDVERIDELVRKLDV
jgi:hypothetical protein